ncbi:hypothetical protein A45J_2689 [hot springs metagenome]|uniref:Uncharacterized protein n=1 Tax=hot springs metagenome TaxID=433727 RepID=A0A5J4L5K7_9ZZZZ
MKMSFKDKLLYKIYLVVETIKEENKKPGLLHLIVLVNIIVPIVLSSLGHADSLQPLVDKTKTEWEGSGVILATLIGVIIGAVLGMFGKGWSGLVYGLLGGFIGGGAYGISSCTTTQGKGINWTP